MAEREYDKPQDIYANLGVQLYMQSPNSRCFSGTLQEQRICLYETNPDFVLLFAVCLYLLRAAESTSPVE